MTYAWAHWLATALRSDPVLAPKVIEVPGWGTRGRPASEFSFFPSGVLEHHTACMCRVGHDPQSCLNGIIAGNVGAPGPISQLLGTFTRPGARWDGRNPDPHILVVAAGRSNHAGTGEYSWGAPSGNGSSIGVEWCGPVDGWPDQVVEFRARVTAAILKNRGWGTHQVDTHFSYARPIGRKVDPSGKTRDQPNLGLTQPWPRDWWRGRVAAHLTPPPPPPPEGVPDVFFPIQPFRNSDTRVFGGFGVPAKVDHRFGIHPDVFPADTVAIALNVTLPSVTRGFITVWPDGQPRPVTSVFHFDETLPAAGAIVVGVKDRHFRLSLSNTAHVICDISGYWTA